MANRLCPLSPGPYLWDPALDGNASAHHMSESEGLINIKQGQRLALKSGIKNQTGQNWLFALLIDKA